MRAIHTIALLPVLTVLCWGQEEGAPKNELAFGLGGLPSLSRSDAPSLNAGPGTGLQVNCGRRFLDGNNLALCGAINSLASPLREVSSSVTSATQNVFGPLNGVETFILSGCHGRRHTAEMREAAEGRYPSRPAFPKM